MEKILEVKDLHTSFFAEQEEIPAVEGVSFTIAKGEKLGIVGESGSGKSVTSLSIMGLIPEPPGKITRGRIIFKGEDLLAKTEDEMRKLRGSHISMVFQEPMTSLNPVYTVGKQIAEAIILHRQVSKKEAWQKAIEMLKLVDVPLPEKRIKQYPFQFSGGMRQRVMIAMALSCSPELLIADEPTTALDVTIQAQILTVLNNLVKKIGTAVILITHDLGVIAETADRVLVMYCGKVVEYAGVRDIFYQPYHPYTRGLLNSIPKISGPRKKLSTIKGMAPAPNQIKNGCKFKTRCEELSKRCWSEEPPLFTVGKSLVRCWQYNREML